jgi:hypothetical protein
MLLIDAGCEYKSVTILSHDQGLTSLPSGYASDISAYLMMPSLQSFNDKFSTFLPCLWLFYRTAKRPLFGRSRNAEVFDCIVHRVRPA